MLFLFSSLSKLPSSRVLKVNIIMMSGKALSRSTVKFSTDGKENSAVVSKENNML